MMFRDERFEWDLSKAYANKAKHRVDFDEAATIFEDQHLLLMFDPDHSQTEDRFVAIGMSLSSNLLTVVHVERGIRIRLISARRASPAETMNYVQAIIKKNR
ncbi:MAG: BrnT family toxin [Phycisphaeraceae bacterium]|nr:BrnT family toxin [Phycisphaeraceae bacterium]